MPAKYTKSKAEMSNAVDTLLVKTPEDMQDSHQMLLLLWIIRMKIHFGRALCQYKKVSFEEK